MAANIPDILAVGDCAETWHHILKSKMYMPLGTTTHKQGLVAGLPVLTVIDLASPKVVRQYVDDLRQFIDNGELTERRVGSSAYCTLQWVVVYKR